MNAATDKNDKPTSADPRIVKNGRYEVRASSLPAVASCLRHAMASLYRDHARQIHPDIKEEERRYKTLIGTAVHEAMERNVSEDSEELGEIISRIFDKRLDEEGFLDEKFKSKDDFITVIGKMVKALRSSPHSNEWTDDRGGNGNKYEPKVASKEVDPDYILTGHIDCVRKDGRVIDLKTGVTTDQPLYQKQLAAYHLLVKHDLKRESPLVADIVKVARPSTPKFRTDIAVKRYEVKIDLHVRTVPELVKKAGDTIAAFDTWKEDYTKIPANPNCHACVYCSLRNTSACPETQYEVAGAEQAS